MALYLREIGVLLELLIVQIAKLRLLNEYEDGV